MFSRLSFGKRPFVLSAALVAVLLFLLTIQPTQAAIKVTAVLKGYDDGSGNFENGNVSAYLDTTGDNWQSWYHQLNFDNTQWANACGTGTSTKWAGELLVGLYHTDNSPAGGFGYRETRNWRLVDGAPTDNLTYTPDSSGSIITVLSQDVVESAGCGGNCQDEIVTHIFVNLDPDCDGTPNTGSSDLHIYWEARLPNLTSTPVWGGNTQVRIGQIAGSGDKTVNVSFLGPNAIQSVHFTAEQSSSVRLALLVATIVFLLATISLSLFLRKRAAS
ncbi:MAG: hypothetical protein R3C62_09825 [Chloroflexota bacterium]